MLPRECLANWLLCAAVNSAHPDRLAFTSPPTDVGGDGVIVDQVNGETWVMEHVSVLKAREQGAKRLDERILEAIGSKQAKGAAYASGKTLVVFVDSDPEEWFPNRVARALPQLDFEAVWVVGLHGVSQGEYSYNVTRLDARRGDAPVWRITINAAFDDWSVEHIQ
jgi:hypothetical protein